MTKKISVILLAIVTLVISVSMLPVLNSSIDTLKYKEGTIEHYDYLEYQSALWTDSSITTEGHHAIFNPENNKLYMWGENWHYQLAGITRNDDYNNTLQEITIENEVINSVKLASRYTIIVTESGNVYTAGAGDFGQLGRGLTTVQAPLAQVSTLSNVKEVYTNFAGSKVYALTNDNILYGWGENTGYGTLDPDNSTTIISTPIIIDTPVGIIEDVIPAGRNTIYLVIDGEFYVKNLNTNETIFSTFQKLENVLPVEDSTFFTDNVIVDYFYNYDQSKIHLINDKNDIFAINYVSSTVFELVNLTNGTFQNQNIKMAKLGYSKYVERGVVIVLTDEGLYAKGWLDDVFTKIEVFNDEEIINVSLGEFLIVLTENKNKIYTFENFYQSIINYASDIITKLQIITRDNGYINILNDTNNTSTALFTDEGFTVTNVSQQNSSYSDLDSLTAIQIEGAPYPPHATYNDLLTVETGLYNVIVDDSVMTEDFRYLDYVETVLIPNDAVWVDLLPILPLVIVASMVISTVALMKKEHE